MATLYSNDPVKNVGALTTHDPTIAQAVAITEPSSGAGGGGYYRRKHRFGEHYPASIAIPVEEKHPQRSEAAQEAYEALVGKILETGIVKDKHEKYDPKYNKRFKVPQKQAERVAYSILKKEGKQMGGFRHALPAKRTEYIKASKGNHKK